jgi:hypothetical protein
MANLAERIRDYAIDLAQKVYKVGNDLPQKTIDPWLTDGSIDINEEGLHPEIRCLRRGFKTELLQGVTEMVRAEID